VISSDIGRWISDAAAFYMSLAEHDYADEEYKNGGWMFARTALHGCSSRMPIEVTDVDTAIRYGGLSMEQSRSCQQEKGVVLRIPTETSLDDVSS
jgi:hypothetical protein